jgi:PAS domain S-box-containing protein
MKAADKGVSERGRIDGLIRVQRDLGIALGATTRLDDGLRLCLEAALEASGMDCGAVYLADDSSGALNIAVHQGLPPDFVRAVSHYDADSANARLVVAGEALYTGHRDQRFALDDAAQIEGFRSAAAIPMCSEDRVIGCLNVASHTLDNVPPVACEALETIGAQIGSAVARLKAGEALRESEERYRLLAENVIDIIWAMDMNLKFTYVSPSVTRLRGHSVEEAMALSLEETLTPASFELTMKVFAEEMAKEEDGEKDLTRSVKVQVEEYCKDGSTVWVEVEATFIHDQNGQAVEIVGIARDITERRKTEEALAESEERFRNMLESSFDMVYRLDLKTGRYDYVSPASSRMLGYSPEEFIALGPENAADMIHPDDMPGMIENVIELISRQKEGSVSSAVEYRMRHRELGYRWMSDSRSVIFDGENAPVAIVGTLRDITGQKDAGEALRESEKRLRALIENAPESIVAYDFDGTILDANRKAEELIGFSREEMIGRNLLELGVIPEDYVPRTSEALAKSDEGIAAQPFEFELVRKDGVRITIDATTVSVEREGMPEVLCISRDITERKQMEEALRLKEKAIEHTVSAIAMSDMEGKVTYVNRACMRLWGSDDKADLIGKPYWVILKSDEAVADIAAVMLESGAWEGELIAIRKDGEEIHVQVSAGLVKDDRGNPIQTISSFLDVTEAKRAEEERKRMEQQLQLAGRLAAVGELAAGIAHELNNPLAAVQAFAQFLAERDDIDETAKGDLQTIYRESQRASRITGNLLSFARKHKPDRSLISINDVVIKSLELHDYRLKVNNIELVQDLDPDMPMTMADFHQMQQVFVNIITNAEQAMTEAHGKGRLRVATQTADETILITFTDTGPGVPEDDLKSIFDPFFTTKDVGKGTGLGLSICFGIVQEHGGQFYARSVPGEGTTFFVELPIAAESQVAPEEAESTHYLQSTPRYF